jgi:histidinol-phosphate/aromatic aminotransferase/cobyric acid decarboxylase-like protein
MVKSIPRIRKHFKKGYTYLNRNMIMDEHPKYIFNELLNTFEYNELHQYPDMFPPYKILSEYLKIDENKLLLTRGVEGSIKTVFESLNLKSTDKVGAFVPTCAMFKVYADVFDVKFIPIKGEAPDYNITIDQIKNVLPQIKILFLTNPMSHLENNFNNNELNEIINLCEKNNVIVFLDEVYIGWESKSYLPYLNKHNNLIISSSFSKIGFPSIKTGWLACCENLKLQLEATRGAYELDYFSNKTLEYIVSKKDYFKELKNNLLEIKKSWIKKFKQNKKFKVYSSALYTVRLYSEDIKLVKNIYNNLYKNKIVVNIIDHKNLQFSVTSNKKIENLIFNEICR